MSKQSSKVNCSGVVIVTVLCVVFFLSQSVRAEDPFADGPYPVGWWDAMHNPGDPLLVAGHGSNVTLAYWQYSTPSGRQQYLDNAEAAGVRVIMSINEDFINATDPVDVIGIINLVNTYNDHPAVAGWSTADEPWGHSISFDKMQLAYDMIKLVSTKPVFITFTQHAINEAEVNPTIPVQWKTAYDHFLVDVYPAVIGEPEFCRLENEGRSKDFKNDMIRAHQQSILADRPWWAVLQGWGSNNTGEVEDYRLPTYNESRFMTYWALSEEPTGILHFAYYRTGGGRVPARPEEPYPYNGAQWLVDVYEPQTVEINMLGPALQNGKITGAASDDKWDVLTDVYQDPDTGKYYMVTLNSTTGSETTTFTVTLFPPGEKFISATPLFEGAQPAIPIIGAEFSDTFSQYEVHVYELNAMLLGDANGDGVVSADDYGSVQSNFGDTGVPGLPGDANGTGAVSADDYGSVQSNFGTTTGMGGVPIPEPTSAALLMLGFSGLLWRRMKR